MTELPFQNRGTKLAAVSKWVKLYSEQGPESGSKPLLFDSVVPKPGYSESCEEIAFESAKRPNIRRQLCFADRLKVAANLERVKRHASEHVDSLPSEITGGTVYCQLVPRALQSIRWGLHSLPDLK